MTNVMRPIRLWVRLYTAGLEPNVRDDRRAEIESDLWEQSTFSAPDGVARVELALEVWSRCLLGVADDLTWRAEQRAEQRPQPVLKVRSRRAIRESGRRLLVLGSGMTIALALVSLVAIVNTIEYRDGTQPDGAIAVLLILLAAAIAVIGGMITARGFWIMRVRSAEGALLVFGGSFVAGLAWYWLFAPVVLAMVVSIYGLARASRAHDGSTSR
jgi:hypothetical protein